MGSLWLILLFNSHSLLYRIIVAYSPFQQPFIVICELVAYSTFQQPFIVIQDHCGLFSFSTAIHCYIESLRLIFLQNSHSLLYGIIVAYSPFQQPFIVICELVPYSPFQQPFIVIQDHCGLFSFRTFTHCYMGSLWLILLQNSHSLLSVKLWLILLFNSHSLLYMIIVAYFRFQHPFIVICELVSYSPFQQPFIVIQDHCGLFSFSTAIHCYIGSLWLIFLQNNHSLLYGIIVAYSPLEQPFIVICEVVTYSPFQQPFIVICELVAYSPLEQPFIVTSDNCGLFSFSTDFHCYIGSLWLILLQKSHSLLYGIIVGLFSFRAAIHCFMRSCG